MIESKTRFFTLKWLFSVASISDTPLAAWTTPGASGRQTFTKWSQRRWIRQVSHFSKATLLVSFCHYTFWYLSKFWPSFILSLHFLVPFKILAQFHIDTTLSGTFQNSGPVSTQGPAYFKEHLFTLTLHKVRKENFDVSIQPKFTSIFNKC